MSKRVAVDPQASSNLVPTKKPRIRSAIEPGISDPTHRPEPVDSDIVVHSTVTADKGGRTRRSKLRLHRQDPESASGNGNDDNDDNNNTRPEATDASSSNVQHTNNLTQGDATGDPRPKRIRETTHSRIGRWMVHRSELLDELMRHDGPCMVSDPSNVPCPSCEKRPSLYRCRDCAHGLTLQCSVCLLEKHKALPLHRVQKWNGQFFEKSPLQSLGLRVQLGHDGETCPNPEPGPKGFMVFDISGAHYVNLTLQGKGNLYDYYHSIVHKTDNANIELSIYRYHELCLVFRLYQDQKLLKRAGRGLEPDGVATTPQGGTAFECGACPHPGKNLPKDWEQAGALLFLYTLFIGVDANFKLKAKNRSLRDIEILHGTGLFVNEPQYQNHIKNYQEQPELNTCESEHDAIVKASTSSTLGYAISGKGLALCSRHLLVRKNGVGDLQKGERYCNMDFIVLSALMGIALRHVVITYDIACQWSKNLFTRMRAVPEDMKINTTNTSVRFAIPSWHINGHGQSCREKFNIAFLTGAAKTCGEEVEINWSHVNPLAPSIREMSLAAHREALNDHWNGWNFRRTVTFRTHFLRRLKEAIKMQKTQEAVYSQLTATTRPSLVKKWSAMISKWESDPAAPNPYEEPKCGTTLNDVRLALAKEDAADAAKSAKSKRVSDKAKISLSAFIWTAFDIEDRQFTLQKNGDNTRSTSTTKKVTNAMIDYQEKETGLMRQIQGWREAQAFYTPYAVSLIASNPALNDAETPPQPSSIPLYLPSSFPAEIRRTLKPICDKEQRLREGQANDSLMGLRRQLRVLQGMKDFKRANVDGTGNRVHTRTTAAVKQVQDRIDVFAARYRRAYAALCVLDPNATCLTRFKPLADEDIRGPAREVSKSTSNSRFVPSWIWLVAGSTAGDDGSADQLHDSLRVEWAKARARMLRWKEEYLLTLEEMRRVISWFEYRASEWESASGKRTVGDGSILRGAAAYAHRQAHVCRQMALRCATYWIKELDKLGITPTWATAYSSSNKSGKDGNEGQDVKDADNIDSIDDDSDSDEGEDGILEEHSDVEDSMSEDSDGVDSDSDLEPTD
ncbi:hypothetical protein CVT24_011092 [Panaeolus cyanescens]|uniref:CxC2-like cysteine cluster KDZ transposase-associated domain-containing protein n=1 Tax=Panaeolus cyanescens TaxID=181874 RepID=A0A409YVE7_9AGAR|nr:hypothetical protein CVT24_011092 [Panaeolus cyanescens]